MSLPAVCFSPPHRMSWFEHSCASHIRLRDFTRFCSFLLFTHLSVLTQSFISSSHWLGSLYPLPLSFSRIASSTDSLLHHPHTSLQVVRRAVARKRKFSHNFPPPQTQVSLIVYTLRPVSCFVCLRFVVTVIGLCLSDRPSVFFKGYVEDIFLTICFCLVL